MSGPRIANARARATPGAPRRVRHFGSLEIRLERGTLSVHRQGLLLLELPDVQVTRCTSRRLEDNARCGLLRVRRSRGEPKGYFIDHDAAQSNIREVDASLANLTAVLAWLLPPGYVKRQGDIGIYAIASLPRAAAEVPRLEYRQAFSDLLGARHNFAPAAACHFFRAPPRRYFVRVIAPARLVHPEHAALTLQPGLYEFIGARGQPLGTVRIPRVGKPAFL
jgi:hypothetical protein